MAIKDTLSLDQDLRISQKLSPRQVQFVRLLEMSGSEIQDEVRTQLEENPALERVDDVDDYAESADDNNHETSDQEQSHDDSIADPEVSTIDHDSDAYDPEDDPADYYRPSRNIDSDTPPPQYADEDHDLLSYLNQQIGVLDLSDRDLAYARYIIGNIDQNGYLTRSLTSMADDITIATGLETTYDDLKPAFMAVRQLDPPGVGAVDLRDCLLLQLQRISPVTLTLRIAREIVSHYFDIFSKKHFDRLQSQLGLTDDTELRQAIQLISRLNPKPGSAIDNSSSEARRAHISPDLLVESTDDGRFSVSLVSNLPQLQIEHTFSADVPADSSSSVVARRNQQARAFIKSKRDDAESFIAALKQRSNTLLAVTEAIVKLQPDFFRTGDTSKLRPMILKDVAQLTGLDLSVISRATANKYVATDTGTYPLKMFFNEAPKENSDTSAHEIQHAIKVIIDNEDKRHPLSDEAISATLAKQGYDIARRTITKYREKLGIPIGRLRKSL